MRGSIAGAVVGTMIACAACGALDAQLFALLGTLP